MKAVVLNVLLGEQGVRLLPENWYFMGKGVIAVFTFDNVIVAKFVRNALGLAKMAATIGAGIHLDQCHDIRVYGADKINNSSQIDVGPLEKTGKRQGQMIAVFVAGSVSYVVNK